MKRQTRHILMLTLALLGLLFVRHTKANDEKNITAFTITPTRCIALHQGQTCYQKITIVWQDIQNSDYCLYQKDNEQAIHCWQSVHQGHTHYEFASDATQTLQLIDIKTKTIRSESTIEVAWVYKANTRRKTHWRLF